MAGVARYHAGTLCTVRVLGVGAVSMTVITLCKDKIRAEAAIIREPLDGLIVSLRETPPYRDPYYWAGFTCWGSDSLEDTVPTGFDFQDTVDGGGDFASRHRGQQISLATWSAERATVGVG